MYRASFGQIRGREHWEDAEILKSALCLLYEIPRQPRIAKALSMLREASEYINVYAQQMRGIINTRDLLGGAQKYIGFAESDLRERARKSPVWRGPWWMIHGLDPAQKLVLAQIDLHNRRGYTRDREFVPVDRETIR
jgi:hypothetical protein